MKKIITTVGASMFSNYMEAKVRNHYGRNYASIDSPFEKTKDIIASDIYKEDYKPYIKNIREKVEDYWYEYNNEPNRFAAAEIASILKIAEEEPGETFIVHLIATDTLQSVLAAEMVTGWFEKYTAVNEQIEKVLFQRPPTKFEHQRHSDYVVKDLRVGDQEDYQQGFMNLIELLDKICEKDQVILNITGGYKAVVPIMTLFGQLREAPIKYLFDDDYLYNDDERQKISNDLISVGKLPVNFDWALGELYLDYITKDGLRNISSNPNILEYLRNVGLIRSHHFQLTPVGQLFKDYITPMLTRRKGETGYLIELRLFKHFVQKSDFYGIDMGRTYWWDIEESSLHYSEPQYNRDVNKEKPIEIDLVLTHGDGNETWVEVKSWSETGLKKAKKQIEERMQFWKSTSVKAPNAFNLLLYKLPHTPNDHKVGQILEIARLFQDEACLFKVSYFDLPITNKGLPNIKVLCEKEPEITELKISND